MLLALGTSCFMCLSMQAFMVLTYAWSHFSNCNVFTQPHVQLKFPELTKLGMKVLQFKGEETFYVYPEADMLLSLSKPKTYSSFSDWGKGWADPEIRQQRLERMQFNKKQLKPSGSRRPRKPRKQRKRKSSKQNPDMRTARGRIAAKISKSQC